MSWLEAKADMGVDRDVMIPMRDKTRLEADIYRPAEPGEYPVLVTRSPYGRKYMARLAEMNQALARYWVSHGYVMIDQDCRGRFTSEGEFYPVVQDQSDGYDTVEWASRQPWSNGKVATVGASYMAVVQNVLAPAMPPSLVTMLPVSAPADFHRSWAYEIGGGFHLFWTLSYALLIGEPEIERRSLPDRVATELRKYIADMQTPWLTEEAVWELPTADWGERLAPIAPYVADYLAHPDDDTYWWQVNVRRAHHRIDVPMFHVSSWHDIFLDGVLSNFSGIQSLGGPRARGRQKLLVGPWAHLEPYIIPTTGGAGDVDFGPEAAIELQEEQRRWYDHWMKGVDTGIMDEPPVRIFVTGADRWRDEDEWPLTRARYTPYYLHSGGAADRGIEDGVLSEIRPGVGESPDTYVYDPADPVPTRGGNLLGLPAGVFDQRDLEPRPDILVYSTPVLTRDLEVTGPITVVLYAASSAYDTDFMAKLVDVRPDGYVRNLRDGMIRARYRDSATNPTLITPGRVYRYEIELIAVSHVFKVDHRLRLHISSSNFPWIDRNPNTGRTIATETELAKAHQMIFHDAERASHVLLPVIPT